MIIFLFVFDVHVYNKSILYTQHKLLFDPQLVPLGHLVHGTPVWYGLSSKIILSIKTSNSYNTDIQKTLAE